MGKYNGAKDRLSRREGVDLFGKGVKLTRLNIFPGVHGPKGKMRKESQYGKQLREKQKTKRIYGILEKQFKIYVKKALKSRKNTGEVLLNLLEKRLDNVVYRLGFAKTRIMARQLVSHKHILVNGKKVNISSYEVKIDDLISVSAKILSNVHFTKLLVHDQENIPLWLEKKANTGKVIREPIRSDINEPIFEQDIVEFYSR